MSYFVVIHIIQVAAAISLVIRYFLNQQQESTDWLIVYGKQKKNHLPILVLLDFSLTVKAAPHECVIRTSQP